MKKNYYEVLEIALTATEKDIRKQYRKLSKKYHPDVNNEDKVAEERFKQIKEAYETLTNKNKRAEYDRVTFADQATPDYNPNLPVIQQPNKFAINLHPVVAVAAGIGLVVLAINSFSKPKRKRKVPRRRSKK